MAVKRNSGTRQGAGPKRNRHQGRNGGNGKGIGGNRRNNAIQRRGAEQALVTEPLTPKTLRREVRASANAKFRPLERAMGADLRASERRVKEQGDWWRQYLDTVSGVQTETKAAYDAAGDRAQAQIQQLSQIDNANTMRLQSEANASAALRGVAPSNAPAQREAAAQGMRNYLAAAQAGATDRLGANQFAYLGNQKRIGVGQSIASRKEEQRRGRSIRQDRQALRRERGDFAHEKRGELRDKEREYLIQKGAFQLDKRNTRLDEREAAVSAAQAQAEAAEDRRQNQIENRQKNRDLGQDDRKIRNEEREARQERRENKKNGGLTPSERRDARAGRKDAWATAKRKFELREWKSWAELEQAVAKESEVSPSDARWAVNRLRKKVEKKERREKKKSDLIPDLNPFG